MPVQTGATINVANDCTGLNNCLTNLQTALNQAQPGDTLILKAGDTFAGNFVLPVKSNPNNKWVVMQSSALANLPPDGQRVQLMHAQYMPKIIASAPGNPGIPTISTAPGTNGWRFIGLEITLSAAYTGTNYGLLVLGDASAPAQDTLAEVPYNFVVDRSYIHRHPTVTVRRCVSLNAGSTAIVDSMITECHEKGSDSQATWGSNGPGPYKIDNNLLEGDSGRNFGGASNRHLTYLLKRWPKQEISWK